MSESNVPKQLITDSSSNWDVIKRSNSFDSTDRLDKSTNKSFIDLYVKRGINLRSNSDDINCYLIILCFGKNLLNEQWSTRKLKSRVVKSKSINPEFKEVFHFTIHVDDEGNPLDFISIQVWESLLLKQDGCVDVYLDSLIRDKENNFILTLEGVECGQLEISIVPRQFGMIDESNTTIDASSLPPKKFNTSLSSSNVNSPMNSNSPIHHSASHPFLSPTTPTFSGIGSSFGSSGILSERRAPPAIKDVATFLKKKRESDTISNKQLLNGRYRITKNLEKGGFGTVYLVIDEKTGEEKALKKITCKTIDDANRAIKEAWPFKSLIHENLVVYEDMFLDIEENIGGEVYFYVCYVMPFYKKGDLYTLLEAKSKSRPKKYIKPFTLSKWFVMIAKGIEFLHKHQVVHRDLKLKNIFFTDGYQSLKIGDFGFATYVEEGKAYTLLGSMGYIAPEIQTSATGYGVEVDIWSLGIMVYEMITLKLGKEQVSHAILAQYNYEEYVRKTIEEEVKKAYPEPIVHDLFISFLKKMLLLDPKTRISASECLNEARDIRQKLMEFEKVQQNQ